MKKLFLLIVIILVMLPVNVFASNMITNGDFETGSVSDWSTKNTPTALVSGSYACHGSYGLRLSSTTDPASYMNAKYIRILANPNTVYYYHFALKKGPNFTESAASNGHRGIFFEQINTTTEFGWCGNAAIIDLYTYSLTNEPDANGWYFCDGSFTTTSETRSLLLFLTCDNTDIIFDDIYVSNEGYTAPKILSLTSPTDGTLYQNSEPPTITMYHENIDYVLLTVNDKPSEPVQINSASSPIIWQFTDITEFRTNAINSLKIEACDSAGVVDAEVSAIERTFTMAEAASAKYLILNIPTQGSDYNVNSPPRVVAIAKNYPKIRVRTYSVSGSTDTLSADKYYTVPADYQINIPKDQLSWQLNGSNKVVVDAINSDGSVGETKTVTFRISATGTDTDAVIGDSDGDGVPDVITGPVQPAEPDGSILGYLKWAFEYFQYTNRLIIGMLDNFKNGILGSIASIGSIFTGFFSWLPAPANQLILCGLGLSVALRIFKR